MEGFGAAVERDRDEAVGRREEERKELNNGLCVLFGFLCGLYKRD